MTVGSRERQRKGIRTRIRDLILEVGIALLVVCGVLYAAADSSVGEATFRWIGLGAITVLTFGYPLREFRRYWGRGRFWGTWIVLLILHLAAYVHVLLTVEHFGYLWFGILTPIEWVVIYPLLEIAGRTSARR